MLPNWSAVRSVLFGAQTQSSFIARLVTNLFASATGSPTPTSSRALASYQQDFEGLYHLVPSGATREQGAAYYQNLYVSSAALGTQGVTVIAGTYAVSFSGTGTITFSGANVGSLVGSAVGVNVGAIITTTAGTLTSTVTGTVTNAMLENKTGATNQNPAPFYVDDATAYGANVNGVRYDDHLNASTIAATILTRATGAHIDSSQAAAAGGVTAGVVDATGPKGLLIEGAAENVSRQSQTYSSADWTKTHTTLGTLTTGPDGGATATPIIDDATTNNHLLQHASFVAVNGTTYTGYVVVKNVDRRYINLDLSDGLTGGVYAYFDLQTGAISQAATNGGSWTNGIASIHATVWGYICIITGTLGANNLVNLIMSLSNSPTGGELISYDGTGAKSVLLWQSQLVVGAIVSSPIPTTTVAVTRPADVEQYVSAGNLSATAMMIAMEITPSTAISSALATHFGTYVDANNFTVIQSSGGVLYATKKIGGAPSYQAVNWSAVAGTTARVVVRFDTINGIDIWLNGTKASAAGKAGSDLLTASQIGTNFQIGGDGNGANQDYCEHRDFVVYPCSATDIECKEMSIVGSGIRSTVHRSR